VSVEHGGLEVQLVCCHLKSKLLSFPNHNSFVLTDEDQRARYGACALYRRTAEAATIRSYVDQPLDGQGQQRPVIVLGDMNDELAAATTQILLGPPGSQIKAAEDTSPGDGGFGNRRSR
jgi:predicted extracellular nuclease